jgi:hypothetical protein
MHPVALRVIAPRSRSWPSSPPRRRRPAAAGPSGSKDRRCHWHPAGKERRTADESAQKPGSPAVESQASSPRSATGRAGASRPVPLPGRRSRHGPPSLPCRGTPPHNRRAMHLEPFRPPPAPSPGSTGMQFMPAWCLNQWQVITPSRMASRWSDSQGSGRSSCLRCPSPARAVM